MKTASTFILLIVALLLPCSPHSQTLTRDQQAAISRHYEKPKSHAERQGSFHRPLKNQYSACDTITTLFTPDNGLDGVMFDVVAHTDIVISSLISFISVTGEFSIYYRNGTHLNNENDSTVWTLAGSAQVAANPNAPIPIPLQLQVLSGDTMGFYLASTDAGTVRYTDAVTGVVGDVYCDNGDAAILQGSGVSWPFDLVFSPRIFNGTVEYCTGTVGIKELNATNVSVYPNPVNEFTTFTFSKSEKHSIEIFDSKGVLMKRIKVEGTFYKMTRENLPCGVYAYRIVSDDNKSVFGKLILY